MKKAKKNRTSSMVEPATFGSRAADILIVLLCALVAFCCVIPLWHVLMSSFSDPQLLLKHDGLVLWPLGNATLDGYTHILTNAGLVTGFFNTLLYTIAPTAIGFVIAALAGYAMTRKTKLSLLMSLMCTITLLLSGGLVPTYMVIRSLGWTGKRIALIIPACTSGINALMMMNAFKQIPREYEEAAQIDGAGPLTMLFRILLPQAKGMSSVLILNSIVANWNSWFDASIYVPNNKNAWPLQLWIRQLVSDNENFLLASNPDYTRYLIQFAVIVVSTLPILVLILVFQEQLEKGVLKGGVKG